MYTQKCYKIYEPMAYKKNLCVIYSQDSDIIINKTVYEPSAQLCEFMGSKQNCL